MDEPLSNLDAKLRVQMRADIAKLQRDLGTTTVYVTHDQVEAMTMGDRVAVMNQGVLQQVDTPQRLYDQPANLFVAGFIGTPPMNLLEARRVRRNGDASRSTSAASDCRCQTRRCSATRRCAAPTGGDVVVGLRAERPPSRAATRPDLPTLTARLELIEALGSESIAYFRIDAHGDPARGRRRGDGRGDGRRQGVTAARPNLVASVPAESAYGLELDADIPIAVDAAKLHFFDQESGEPLR